MNLKNYFFLICFFFSLHSEEIPLFWWKIKSFENFGDALSQVLVERIINSPIRCVHGKTEKKKLLGLGSILTFARTGDIVWGSGINGKFLEKKHYVFSELDVRSVRGPLTRRFLKEQCAIDCPPIYGDPALLFPLLFPEFTRSESPSYEFILIPHYSDNELFPKSEYPNVVYATDPWQEVLRCILDSKFVISSSLHGIILAEAYGIPARLIRLKGKEPLFKYEDYYLGTNRPHFQFATSLEKALEMGGEPPFECDLQALYQSFPFEMFPDHKFTVPFPFYSVWHFPRLLENGRIDEKFENSK